MWGPIWLWRTKGTCFWSIMRQNVRQEGIKKKIINRLTFLLSSISCSNIALNTGERAVNVKERVFNTQQQQQKRMTKKKKSVNYNRVKQRQFFQQSWIPKYLSPCMFSEGYHATNQINKLRDESQHYKLWYEKPEKESYNTVYSFILGNVLLSWS